MIKKTAHHGFCKAKKALEKLDDPHDLGKIEGKLSREEIY